MVLVMSPTRSGQALRELVLEVFRLNGALLRHGAALTAPVEQSQARWQVIGAVAEATRTVPQIARRMGMSRQSVQRVADLLAQDGILRLETNPDHVRSPLLRLTPKGEQIEAELTALSEEWAAEIAADLPRRELEEAVKVVRKVTRKLDGPVPAARD
jgi:DNA-binding MarR family transcriptional regulator